MPVLNCGCLENIFLLKLLSTELRQKKQCQTDAQINHKKQDSLARIQSRCE